MSRIEEFGVSIAMSDYVERFRDVEHFMGFCRECNAFGKTWACPPFQDETTFAEYTHANLFATKIWVEPSLCDVEMSPEELREATMAILEPVRAELDDRLLALESSTEGSRALFAGSCRRCAKGECTRPSGEPCTKPSQMRPSLEAMGFDVGRSASELLGVELQWSSGKLPQYFTLVYALFSRVEVADLQPLH